MGGRRRGSRGRKEGREAGGEGEWDGGGKETAGKEMRGEKTREGLLRGEEIERQGKGQALKQGPWCEWGGVKELRLGLGGGGGRW